MKLENVSFRNLTQWISYRLGEIQRFHLQGQAVQEELLYSCTDLSWNFRYCKPSKLRELLAWRHSGMSHKPCTFRSSRWKPHTSHTKSLFLFLYFKVACLKCCVTVEDAILRYLE